MVEQTSHATQLMELKETLGADCRYVLVKCEVRCNEDAEHTHRISSFHRVCSECQCRIVKEQETCDGVPGASPHQLSLFGVEFQLVG